MKSFVKSIINALLSHFVFSLSSPLDGLVDSQINTRDENRLLAEKIFY